MVLIAKSAMIYVDEERSEGHKKTGRQTLQSRRGRSSCTIAQTRAPHRQAIAHIKVVDKPKATDMTAMEHRPIYMTGNRP